MERIVDSTTKPCLCLSCPVHLSCNIVSLTWYFSGADTGASQLLSLLSVSFSLLFMFKTIIRILFLGPTFYFFYFYFFLHFFKFYFLTLQYCIGFAIYQHESATGIQVFPILNPPPSSLPIPSFWVVPVHQPQASSIVHRTWTGNSFHTWYFTWFNAILPNLPTLSLSHRVHKTVLYISVSFAVSYTGLLLPSF